LYIFFELKRKPSPKGTATPQHLTSVEHILMRRQSRIGRPGRLATEVGDRI